MLKKIITYFAIFSLIIIAWPTLARPNLVAVRVGPSGQIVTVPAVAVEVSPALYYLGEAVDQQSGKVVEGYALIRYKENYAKPPWAGGGQGRGTTKCYAFLGNNTKWQSNEAWLVNPENANGLTSGFIYDNLTADITKWEDAADGVINGNLINILGNGSITNNSLNIDFTSPDGLNEVYFADVIEPGAIAITVVWGIFTSPPSQRELLEWDQVYDDVDYQWSASGQSGMMDFENIATHELGHSVGLADVYESACSQVTMYGYSDYGEINKRTLEASDIIGVSTLY